MGVDYDGVGGVGVTVTPALMEKLVAATGSGDDYYEREVLENSGFRYAEGGSACYGGEATFYLFVPGETLGSVLTNEGVFRQQLADLGFEVSKEDLEVISDLYVC